MKFKSLLVVLVASLSGTPILSHGADLGNSALVEDGPIDLKTFVSRAESNDVSAQFVLGFSYYFGENGLEQDRVKAVKWLTLAAQNGDAESQFMLGKCLFGQGVLSDEKAGFEWFKKAANQNLAMAQYEMGRCFRNGWGCEKNPGEAVKWFRLAAEQGDSSAQLMLGVCYMSSDDGVTKNIPEAMRWYQKAADQGNEQAKKILDSLRNGPSDLSAIKNLVYITLQGTRFSEILTDKVPVPHLVTFALDLDSGKLFNEKGGLILTFKDISSDVLYGEKADAQARLTYKFNRVAGTAVIKSYQNGESRALVVVEGPFTVRKKQDRVF